MENELGNMIRGFLYTHRLTQSWLANKTGVSNTFVSGVINGKSPLSVAMAYKIGREFDKIHKIKNGWAQTLLNTHLNETCSKIRLELTEYTKQQE